jgi:hypothetical protein
MSNDHGSSCQCPACNWNRSHPENDSLVTKSKSAAELMNEATLRMRLDQLLEDEPEVE